MPPFSPNFALSREVFINSDSGGSVKVWLLPSLLHFHSFPRRWFWFFAGGLAALHSAGLYRNEAQGESYAHPKTCFFHVVFKAAAIVFYILSSFFNENFVIDFVVTILLVALDFWVVKNVSGRILVGLRWWNEINESGESIWRYECLDPESLARINKKDSWLFWWTLYVAAIIWSALGIVAIVKINIDYLLVDGICLTLTIANIIGFEKCRKDAKRHIQDFASQSFASHVSSTLQSAFSVV